MRRRSLVIALMTAAACAAPQLQDTRQDLAPTSPVFVQNGVDTVGLPDLIVDSRATQQHWINRVEDLPANFCSVQEGGIVAGVHNILRFSVTTPNIGDADVFVGSPKEHVALGDGLFELATCHGHYHFTNYATYRLVDEGGREWKAAKRGFCMLDTDPYNVGTGDGTWNYRNCGSVTRDGFQGISDGWADTYTFKLGGQYFVLDGGDNQPPVPPGIYYIKIEVNPAYDPPAGGTCPRVTDPATGKCHQFAESNYANNYGEARIEIASHPGRTGYGPLNNNNDKISATDDAAH